MQRLQVRRSAEPTDSKLRVLLTGGTVSRSCLGSRLPLRRGWDCDWTTRSERWWWSTFQTHSLFTVARGCGLKSRWMGVCASGRAETKLSDHRCSEDKQKEQSQGLSDLCGEPDHSSKLIPLLVWNGRLHESETAFKCSTLRWIALRWSSATRHCLQIHLYILGCITMYIFNRFRASHTANTQCCGEPKCPRSNDTLCIKFASAGQ